MTGNGEEAPFIFIVAGEPSGDALGGALIRALRKRTGGRMRVAGIGGESMAEQGVASLVPLSDLAVAGIAEVLPRAPLILRRVRETLQAIRQLRPDAVVTIDSSGFSWRIAHRLRRHGERLPLIHYVAPMVWAWRPGRARRMARWYDHLLTLLPFEPPYFEAVGLACSYVGHPVIESGADRGDAARFRAIHGIAENELVLTVLPGSRGGEVRPLLPVFGAALRRLGPVLDPFRVAAPRRWSVAERTRRRPHPRNSRRAAARRGRLPYDRNEGVNPDVDDQCRYEGRRRGRARHLPAAAHDAAGQRSRQIAAVLHRAARHEAAAQTRLSDGEVHTRLRRLWR